MFCVSISSPAHLKTELEVIYSKPDFSQITEATNVLILLHLHTDIFSETTKITSTTPMTTAE